MVKKKGKVMNLKESSRKKEKPRGRQGEAITSSNIDS